MKRPVHKLNLSLYPKGDVTQWFGENEALYQKMVIVNGVPLKGHNGIDIVRPHGTAILSIESGIVVDVKENPQGYGKYVRIVSGENEWTYGHLSAITVKLNEEVKEGQVIGLMGNTGFVISGATPYWKHNPYAGTHLHLGLRKVKLVKTGGWVYPGTEVRVKTLNYDNGYFGSIDPFDDLMWADDEPEADYTKSLQLTVISLLKSLINKLK